MLALSWYTYDMMAATGKRRPGLAVFHHVVWGERMVWVAVGAGIVSVWVGLALYCAEAFMGRRDVKSRRPTAGTEREHRTPIPSRRVAD
jgi:hypothetical protein